MKKFLLLQFLSISILLTGCEQIIDRTVSNFNKSDKIEERKIPINPNSQLEISEKAKDIKVNPNNESLDNDLQTRDPKNLLIPEIRGKSDSGKTRLNVIGISKDGPYRSDISKPNESRN